MKDSLPTSLRPSNSPSHNFSGPTPPLLHHHYHHTVLDHYKCTVETPCETSPDVGDILLCVRSKIMCSLSLIKARAVIDRPRSIFNNNYRANHFSWHFIIKHHIFNSYLLSKEVAGVLVPPIAKNSIIMMIIKRLLIANELTILSSFQGSSYLLRVANFFCSPGREPPHLQLQ